MWNLFGDAFDIDSECHEDEELVFVSELDDFDLDSFVVLELVSEPSFFSLVLVGMLFDGEKIYSV